MNRPRIVLAAPASGSGKTMLTCGLLQALVDRGLKVSSFKCGPDYIDPLFHEKVIGTKSANLDLFFTPADRLRTLFCRNSQGSDISVVEGVMGYYDGLSVSSTEASTYEVAGAIGAPVVLIVNARGQGMSALASVKGFLDFCPDSGIRGVIFNQMSAHVFQALKDQVAAMGVLPLGYVPKAEDLVIESRHLGLVSPEEIAGLSRRLHDLAAMMEKTVDLEALLKLAAGAPELPQGEPERLPDPVRVRIALARDEAFTFLYRDNLTLLQDLGAEILPFSPIRDEKIPAGAQGLILPGGYPELYAKQLSENESMRRSIAEAVEGGMPCLAECGGFLYLHRVLEDMDGTFWPMAGVIDGKAYRTKKLGRYGYINLQAAEDSALLRREEILKGHEFHYFESTACGEAMEAVKPLTGISWQCIHDRGTLLAGFPHLFYRSAPGVIARYLRLCAGKEED